MFIKGPLSRPGGTTYAIMGLHTTALDAQMRVK